MNFENEAGIWEDETVNDIRIWESERNEEEEGKAEVDEKEMSQYIRFAPLNAEISMNEVFLPKRPEARVKLFVLFGEDTIECVEESIGSAFSNPNIRRIGLTCCVVPVTTQYRGFMMANISPGDGFYSVVCVDRNLWDDFYRLMISQGVSISRSMYYVGDAACILNTFFSNL